MDRNSCPLAYGRGAALYVQGSGPKSAAAVSCGLKTPGHHQVALTTLLALPDCQALSYGASFCLFPERGQNKEAAKPWRTKTPTPSIFTLAAGYASCAASRG